MVVPWRFGCYYRSRNLDHLRDRWDLPYTIALGHDPWCKAKAVMPSVDLCRHCDVVVIHDADVWCPNLGDAVSAVLDGAPWAVPHTKVRRLSNEGTIHYIANGSVAGYEVEKPYRGVAGGGVVVARPETLLDIPLDPRFVGWGQEDESWGWALEKLAGEPWRGTETLIHLWHPPQERWTRTRGSHGSWELRRRYHRAIFTADDMRTLVNEAKHLLGFPTDAQPAHQS